MAAYTRETNNLIMKDMVGSNTFWLNGIFSYK